MEWANQLSDQLANMVLPGGHPNLLGPEETARVQQAYGVNLARLRKLKQRYDPERVISGAVGSFAELTHA
jgi:hypothetical protein